MGSEEPGGRALGVAPAEGGHIHDDDGEPELRSGEHVGRHVDVGGVVVANGEGCTLRVVWCVHVHAACTCMCWRGGTRAGELGGGRAEARYRLLLRGAGGAASRTVASHPWVRGQPRTHDGVDEHEGEDESVGEEDEERKEPGPVARHQRHLQGHHAQQRHKGNLQSKGGPCAGDACKRVPAHCQARRPGAYLARQGGQRS